MGRVIWMGTKFVAGVLVGALVGATATAYFAGAGSGDSVSTSENASRNSLFADVRARFDAARVAGDLAAEEIEAAMTQQFRVKVHDPDALNPPNALHP